MIQKLKKLWLVIAGYALIILDFGFDVVNPILIDVGIHENYIKWVKIIFGFYGLYKIYMANPTKKDAIIGTHPKDR